MLVLVEHRSEKALSSLSGSVRIGVLVGKIINDRAFVLHFVPTPILEEACDAEGRSGLPCQDWWIDDHVHQVWDMLPGGLSVVGLCLASPTLKENSTLSLRKLARQLGHTKNILSSQITFLMMHFSTTTARFTCECVSVTTTNVMDVVVLSGKVVLQDLSKMFCCLRSSVGIKLEKPVVNVADQMKFVQNTQHQLLVGLSCWQNSVIVMSNRYCCDDDILEDCEMSDECIQCKIFPKYKILGCGKAMNSGQCLTLSLDGNASIIAYSALKHPVAEASKALCDDVVRTVTIRWRKLYEELTARKCQVRGRLHLPRRLEVAVDGCCFHFCAYLFEKEKENSLIEQVSELLGVRKEMVSIVRCEKVLSEPVLIRPIREGWRKTLFFTIITILIIALPFIIFWKF